MKKNSIFLTTIALIAILVPSCKNDSVPSQPRTDIHLDSTNTLTGRHIVDKDGKTLYFFANDANGLSNCIGGCTTNWTAYLADPATTTFSDGLLSTDFATITLASGSKQTTFKGWPMYYYTPAGVQEAAGQTTGEGIANIWFVAKANYSIMIANFQLTGNNGTNYLSTYAPGDGRTNYFSDGKGNTLYSHVKDSAYINKFTLPDFSNNPNWPIYETENVTVPSTLDKSLFVVTTFNGKKQLTYKGWPIYYFGPDNAVRGSNKGVSIGATPGSAWPVVIKDAALAPRVP
jgi:predicted lipoprotein with Yx(FWY)xxD motif